MDSVGYVTAPTVMGVCCSRHLDSHGGSGLRCADSISLAIMHEQRNLKLFEFLRGSVFTASLASL